jgi:ribosomal protein L11 methylase PrmA
MALDPGSFRDPDSRVYLAGDGVYRLLSERGRDDWLALSAAPVFAEATAGGTLVATEAVERDAVPGLDGLPAAAILRHERVPFVSYPYEWTFGMLRDAALLQLDLLARALEDGLILKDSSPYNVQWRGAAPVFIDVGSFERLRPGEPWVGYRQFCMLFLYPLMLTAFRGVPFQPWLRGSLEGIAPTDAARLLSGRDRLRRGVLTNVVLHARLERRYAAVQGREVKRELRGAGFGAELVKANVRKMRKLVDRLRWEPGESAWTAYGEDDGYAAADREAKSAFVREAAGRRPRRLAWDLGANDGDYARIAADAGCESVLAMDADHPTVELLYRALREQGERRILPLVVDVCDPSPALGWRGRERAALLDRGRPELVLCLALVHHLAITRNVPLADVVAWLHALGGELVVEFPTREDPMVQRLLAAKNEGAHGDYELEAFERALGAAFEIRRRETLPSGTRVLFDAAPRSAG